MEYDLPADRSVKILSLLAFFASLSVRLFFAYMDLISKPIYVTVALSILAVPGIAFLYAPRKIKN